MRVAVVGPLCRDTIIIAGQQTNHLGGVTYYAGRALASLGADVTVIATFGVEPKNFTAPLGNIRLIHIPAAGTLHFVNTYSSAEADARQQHAVIPINTLTPADLTQVDLHTFDAIILGPLFHGNLPTETLTYIAKAQRPTYLAGQGLFRYLDGERIVWRHPENLTDAIPYVTAIQVDDAELRFLTGQDDVTRGVRALQKAGAHDVLVTSANRGSFIFSGRRRFDIPAFPPKKLADSTGAGDSYLAGYVFTRTNGAGYEPAGRFAAATASLAIETAVAFQGTVTDVEARQRSANL